MKRVIWMKVTNDEYELPVAVADSIGELAKILGTTNNSISSSMSHYRKGVTKKTLYKKVIIEEGEEDD